MASQVGEVLGPEVDLYILHPCNAWAKYIFCQLHNLPSWVQVFLPLVLEL